MEPVIFCSSRSSSGPFSSFPRGFAGLRGGHSGGGYPGHFFFNREHCVHEGNFSSHLILLCLQLLQPILTFSLLVCLS